MSKSSISQIELDEKKVMEIQNDLDDLLLPIANEGVLVAFVDNQETKNILDVMKRNKAGEASEIVGEVIDGPAGRVTLQTVLGSHRIVDKLSGEQLPRIC